MLNLILDKKKRPEGKLSKLNYEVSTHTLMKLGKNFYKLRKVVVFDFSFQYNLSKKGYIRAINFLKENKVL